MNLLMVIIIVSLYYLIGCLIVGLAKNKEQAMNITILLLWPVFIASLLVYVIVSLCLKIGKRGKKST